MSGWLTGVQLAAVALCLTPRHLGQMQASVGQVAVLGFGSLSGSVLQSVPLLVLQSECCAVALMVAVILPLIGPGLISGLCSCGCEQIS
jgi:hypothetical protein